MKKNIIIKNIIIGFIFTIFFVNIFATAHLPPALQNLVNQTNEYLNMTSYFILPFYSLISIINPLYILLGLIYLSFSLLFFKKRNHHIIFLSSFILFNTITYYFQTGLIGILMTKFAIVPTVLGLLMLFSALILTYLIGFKKVKIKNIHINSLALASGIGFGLFFLQIPEKINIALKFALSYNSYFLRFLFSFKIFFFLILSLLPMIYLVNIIKKKKYPWTLKVHSFFNKNRNKIIYALLIILLLIFILSYIYRNYIII